MQITNRYVLRSLLCLTPLITVTGKYPTLLQWFDSFSSSYVTLNSFRKQQVVVGSGKRLNQHKPKV